MLLLERQFDNLFGQSIRLDIYRFTNCSQIMITKKTKRTDSLHWIAFIVLLVSLLFYSNINRILDRLIITCLAVLLMMALVYWRSPVYRESIVLLDNVCGMEVTQDYWFCGTSWKRSQFILTKDIIINEAITMHRVIYYLVAIPHSMSPLLDCEVSPKVTQKPTNSWSQPKAVVCNNNNNLLIPLFCNTYPRIDCLRLIYKQIHVFKTNINRVNPQRVFNQKLQSFSSTNSLHQKNGFRTGVAPLYQRHKQL